MCRCSILTVRARGVTILNSRFSSSSETGVRNGMKSWVAQILSSGEREEAIGGL
jgi:hypothetical protein